ncbi:peptidoglycan D,D-transpeptidase FtsI family protein [Luteolibacter luteus]|uniref:Penicillin-binding protein 2 n=1 Tax=Luteolibacter luteus TaxID=2728835 RepID=A0A858RM67_9BACT|nr:penicillin-binding protein 2 [Luteolibacter luteus]QJE97469.1 penicillin-binding protein 2 [Luteolibacter luteus]
MTPRAFQSRCIVLCSVLVTGLTLLSVRLVKIQAWDRTHYANKARQTFERREILPGFRGKIVDRNEEVLAKSMPVGSVWVNVKHLEDPTIVAYPLAYERVSADPGWDQLDAAARRRRVLAERGIILKESEEMKEGVLTEKALAQAVNLLARPLGMRREDMHAKITESIKKGRGEFLLAKDLPADAAEGVRAIIDKNLLEGFFLRDSFKRWYTSPTLATHVVGYTGETVEKDDEGSDTYLQIGKFGIEAATETYLAGRDGWQEHLRAANGARIPGDSSSLKPPRAGLNVQLTLDMGVQAIIEEELDAGLAEFESKRGCVIVMEPKTGEILGMVSRPHFNNLNRLENLDEPCYALQAIYEPGSTMKIVPAGAAINERLVTPQTTIFCHNGHYQQGKVSVPDLHGYGNLTVEGVLQKSSNIGAYKLAQQLGMSRYYDYVEKWGYGKKTGILLSGESRGIVRNTGNPTDFSRASYGYSLAVTPLQVACAYSVIAGDGKLRKPHIVKSVIANDGTVVERYEPEVVNTVLRPETAKVMRSALEKVVQKGGTATQAAVPGYKVGGKTGTARRIKDGKYQMGHYIVSFAGIMPAEDPAFVCVVVVDDPMTTKVNRYGGSIAGPIFGKIGNRLAAHMNLTPTEPVDQKEDKLAGTQKP